MRVAAAEPVLNIPRWRSRVGVPVCVGITRVTASAEQTYGEKATQTEDAHHVKRMFDTRSHSWREVGLARQLSARAVKRARLQLLVLVPLLAGIVRAVHRTARQLFGLDMPVRHPHRRRADQHRLAGRPRRRPLARPDALPPAGSRDGGTVGFLIRLATVLIAVLVALRLAGIGPRELTIGGAFTAVILGLAAQQTLGNLFAGMVLLSARPFRVGDRVRFQGGAAGGHRRGRRELARPALHRPVQRRGRDHGPQQRRAQRRRSSRCASPTASTCARACAPASRRWTSRSVLAESGRDADPRASARGPRGGRRRRGRRADQRHARTRRRRRRSWPTRSCRPCRPRRGATTVRARGDARVSACRPDRRPAAR